jgi:hypothetical protein
MGQMANEALQILLSDEPKEGAEILKGEIRQAAKEELGTYKGLNPKKASDVVTEGTEVNDTATDEPAPNR